MKGDLMKVIFVLLFILMNFSAFAATPVYDSIYMALGAGRSGYFDNIKRVKDAIRESGFPQQKFDLTVIGFHFASVAEDEVTYFYQRVDAQRDTTCTLSVKFTVTTRTNDLQNVMSTYSCSIDQD